MHKKKKDSNSPTQQNTIPTTYKEQRSEPTFRELPNGLQVVLWPQTHLHSLAFGLYVRSGSRFEKEEQKGITHFLEHVLFRGNARYKTSLEMNRKFESLGGSINAYTTKEYTYFYGRLHPKFLNEGLDFASQLIRSPRFADVDLERDIILEERLQDVDHDGQNLDEDDISRGAFWGDHPLASPIIGVPKSIRRITQANLKKHFQDYFGMKNVILCLTGNFDLEKAFEVIAANFQDLPSGEKKLPLPLKSPDPLQHTAFVQHDSSQVSLLFSFRGPKYQDPDYFSLMLIDRILDDGMSSRLWQNLVEKKGLCYDIWTSIDAYSDVTIFDIGASVAPEKLLRLAEGIYQEITLLRNELVPLEEFEHIKHRWTFRQEYILDHVTSLNEEIGAHTLYETYIPFTEQRKAINALTPAHIQNCAREILQSKRHVLTVVGPLTKNLKRHLRSLAKEFSA